MSAHDERHEELLTELVRGSLSASHARAAELLQCPICGPELERLLRLQAALDRFGDEEEEHLRMAAELEGTPVGAESVERGIRALSRPAHATWRGWILALAAGLVAVVWFAGERGGGEAGPPERSFDVLGGAHDEARVRPLSMEGPVERYGPLVWEGELPATCVWRVQVRSDVEGDTETELAEGEDLLEPRFAPDTEDWPASIRWRISAVGIDDRPVFESDWVHAWLE